jgi:D-lyxose ketol-isomerase
MNRSEINTILNNAEEFIKERCFLLPPFAYWKPQDWAGKAGQVQEIVERRLGWDITDFGQGDFDNCGLFLFTLRNGDLSAMQRGWGKLYAEKILVVGVNQITPLHLHRVKTEDIINRGGGNLAVQLYNSTEKGGIADTKVTVSTDGSIRTVHAGDTIGLSPGESICLQPGLYHKFWGEGSRVLVGEVSTVNNDETDNYFYESVGRFPLITEDELPRYLLVNDYGRYYQPK